LQTITFCGGEVFTLAYFPSLINTLIEQEIFVQVITNGTIDKLDQLINPNFVNLIVSIDGLQEYHDANRGAGNFDKSINFLTKAQKLGFHTEIFSIITKQNLQRIDEFEKTLKQMLNDISITYHPRKPPSYLLHHPVSNIFGEINGFDFLTPKEMVTVMTERNVFPPKDLGCYQIAVMSDERVYGCCEGVKPIGTMNDPIELLIEKLHERLVTWYQTHSSDTCLGCSQSEFMCGIKEYLNEIQKLHLSAA
jgi:hypothetical protein